MKKLLSTLFVVFFATSMMAQTGLTCEDPIPVDKSYIGRVNAGDELWYTASTWDLPMHVYFSPDVDNSTWGPEVTIDFTCDEGNYDHDPKLDSVINILNMLGLELPVEFSCDKVVRNGKVEWDLSIDERYRDQLTEYGLTHDVQAFVKVYFTDGGEIRLTPDPTFQDCMANSHYAMLSDTIDIAANDSNKMIVLPYSEWKDEEVRFVWVGEKPARVWVAEDECHFTPTDASIYIRAKYDLDANTHKVLTPADMQSAIDNWIGAGIFYGKVLSDAPGKLVIERIPLGEIQGDAILLKHGESVQLEANDNRVFCFPKTWKSTEFLANTQYLMAMHVSNTPEFEVGDANVISKYAFSKDGNNRQLQLTTGDITALGASATDDYLYVRFVCNQSTQLTPSLWNVDPCISRTVLIPSGEASSIPASSKNVYRLIYDDFANYDFTVSWTGQVPTSISVSSYCDFETTDPNILKKIAVRGKGSTKVTATDVDSWGESLEEEGYLYLRIVSNRLGDVTFTSSKPAETDPEGPVLDPVYTTESAAICFGESYDWNGKTYAETGKYPYTTVAANGADSIVTLDLTVYPQTPDTTEEVTVKFGETYEWNGQTYSTEGEYTTTLQDENGCDYQATLVLTVLPEEKPEEDGTILLNPTDELTINLDSAINVYHTEYDVWSAAKVQLNWYGDKPLHVFVAKDREFLVAIYHEDVVLYEKIEAVDPANGEPQVLVLDMSALRAYVNDGKLYVRFLTDADARLVIEPLTE